MIISIFKTAALSAGLILGATLAQAAPVATFDVTGDIDPITNGNGVGVTGTFVATLLDPTLNPFAADDYTLDATLMVNGSTVLANTFSVTDTSLFQTRPILFGLVAALNPNFIPAIGNLPAVISANSGVAQAVAPGIFAAFISSGPIPTATGFTESFSSYIGDSITPIFADNETLYSFSVSIERTDLAPIPLPASLPLLAFAGLSLGALARRRKQH